jgi:hypothetical protein
MSLLIDEYRKGWARRYMREAITEYAKAEENPIPNISISFALVSMKKAQIAIYYSLGDPEQLTFVVGEAIQQRTRIQDPVLLLLVQIEQFIHTNGEAAELLKKELAIKEAKRVIDMASTIVELIAGKA